MFQLKIKKHNFLFVIVLYLLIIGSFSLEKTPSVWAAAGDTCSSNGGACGTSGFPTCSGNTTPISNSSLNDCANSNACCVAAAAKNGDQCKSLSGTCESTSMASCTSKTNGKVNIINGAQDCPTDQHCCVPDTVVQPDLGLEQKRDVCAGLSLLSPTSWFNCLLLWIMQFFIIILKIAATLFGMVIDMKVFDQILRNNAAIYTAWATVRDILNICFILVLLFSAFSTVFQIDKYSYKKILLRLVLMALLVNFSYPITRFIIDFSNVIMYHLISGLGITNSNSLWASYAQNGGLATIIKQNDATASTAYLLASVIFVFIFSVTLLILAVLLLIRIIALAILLVFSPVAFTGSIVPGISSHASKWWDSLFNYAFFGPIMIFMVYIATTMMSSIGSVQGVGTVSGSTSLDTSTIGSMASFMIPLVILWIGLGMAQSMSIAGAGAVVGRGKSVMGWGLRTFSGAAFAQRQLADYRKERDTRREQARFRWGRNLGRRVNQAQDTAIGAIPGRIGAGARRRFEDMHNTNVREHMQTINDITNEDELANRFDQARNTAEREAVLRRAASIGGLGTILNRNGQTNDHAGFQAFMTGHFGNNDRSARLSSTLANLESTRHNTQFSGISSFNGAANAYQFNAAGSAAAINGIFANTGGDHPQNVARNLRPGLVVTTGPAGTAPVFNTDFENFLTQMGPDFNTMFLPQANQLPNTVLAQIRTVIAPMGIPAGALGGVAAPAGVPPRTWNLIQELRTAGRI